jgi:hypothetical protein
MAENTSRAAVIRPPFKGRERRGDLVYSALVQIHRTAYKKGIRSGGIVQKRYAAAIFLYFANLVMQIPYAFRGTGIKYKVGKRGVIYI